MLKNNFRQKISDAMPEGAGALFFIQMFAVLAFSVLYSTLVLYATHALKLDDTTATSITASFVAFNYALHLIGGYLGGRFLSYRFLFAIGMMAIILGCLLISIPALNYFYWGLAAFLTGCGLNVTCINCMVTQLFQPTDHRRETAFLWNYSGMNVGFFVGFSLSGYLQLTKSYPLLFILSSLGGLIALLITVFKWKTLADRNTAYLLESKKFVSNLQGIVIIVLMFFGLRWILENARFTNNLIMFVGASMLFVIAYFAYSQSSKGARNKIIAYLILALMGSVFWTLYQLAPMGLMLFIERNVDKHIGNLLIAPQWIQNINTIVIIIGGPLLSILFSKARQRGINFTIPLQFSIALLLIGAAFIILPIGIHYADSAGMTNLNWIIASFVLQSGGELFISPIGYAMIGQLAPANLQGIMMGTWMMVTGVAATLSGYFSNMALGANNSSNPLITNQSFSDTFNLLGWSAIGAGVFLLVLTPIVSRLIQEKKLTHDDTHNQYASSLSEGDITER